MSFFVSKNIALGCAKRPLPVPIVEGPDLQPVDAQPELNLFRLQLKHCCWHAPS